jgi:hypothetical protein
VIHRRHGDVRSGYPEERAEEGQRTGGGGRQRAADPGGRSRRGQGAEVTGALAADQADGHREDRERQEGTGASRDCHDLRRRVLRPADLDREAGVCRGIARVRDLVALQGPARLDEPARNLPPAVPAQTVERDEVRRLAAVSPPKRWLPTSILWTVVMCRGLTLVLVVKSVVATRRSI